MKISEGLEQKIVSSSHIWTGYSVAFLSILITLFAYHDRIKVLPVVLGLPESIFVGYVIIALVLIVVLFLANRFFTLIFKSIAEKKLKAYFLSLNDDLSKIKEESQLHQKSLIMLKRELAREERKDKSGVEVLFQIADELYGDLKIFWDGFNDFFGGNGGIMNNETSVEGKHELAYNILHHFKHEVLTPLDKLETKLTQKQLDELVLMAIFGTECVDLILERFQLRIHDKMKLLR